jgi:ring-1,2-phenylacetyl-CoA epoxidase subunit PaaC
MKKNQTITLMKRSLIDYSLHFADDTLILAQRNAEWCAHGPILEQDIAITNISLDLLGQARNFYQYAAVLIGGDADEDKLAYLRTEREFKNCLLVEQPNGDWGQTVLRQFFFSVYQFLLYQQLQHTKDEQLAAIAGKALKEVTYHLRWSSEWVIRLGDGTTESHNRMLKAIETLWCYTGEFFEITGYEFKMMNEGTGVDLSSLKTGWMKKVKAVFDEATLAIPENVFMQGGGKKGTHTEHMGFILTELQYMQRAYPDSSW